jgi:hypothetical protein
MLGLAALVPLAPGFADDEFKPEPGFKLLFNGKNFDGWRTKGKKGESLEGKTEAYKGRFKIVNGIIEIDPSVKGDLYIETAKEFGKDVHIKFDFNPGPKCNNDMFLRGTKFDIVPKAIKVEEGKWSTLEIIVTGDKVEHKVNGMTARKSDAKTKSSPFMMRAEFGALQIKNIRVKEGS